MIPQWLAPALVGVGALFAWNAWKGRNLPDTPEGIEPGTPPKEWPKELRKEQMAYQLGRHWRAYLVGGLVAATLGIAATVADTVSAVRDAADGEPSRGELIDAIAADPTNTYDRDEAVCLVDFVETTGLDPGGEVSAAAIGRVVGRMSDEELTELESCFDEESRAAARARTLEALSDAELRELVIESLRSAPDIRISREEAECWVDDVIASGLFSEFLEASESGGPVSPELDAVTLAADRRCLG